MKNEIYRALFLALGTFESISNLTYLLKREGIHLARKQHREIPESVTDKQMKIKVICMLVIGIVFFCVSIFSYITHMFWDNAFKIVMGILGLYASCEALFYKYWKTFGFAFLSIILLVLYFVL